MSRVEPTVCVVVPTRNSDRTLYACLRSVRGQSHAELELIVVDNGSSDRTVEIASDLADRVEQWGPERSAQRNRGWRLSRAEIVVFVDSDMVLEPEVVSQAVANLTSEPGVGALVIPELARGEGFLARSRALEKRLYLGDHAVEAARIFRRQALAQVGGYDETLNALEDWDLADRVAAAGYRTGRVVAHAWHDEGQIGLRAAFAKKRYYGRTLRNYQRSRADHRRLALRSALVRQPQVLLHRPAETCGLVVLKLAEAAGFFAGAWETRFTRNLDDRLTATEMRRMLQGCSVAFVVPSCREGVSIRRTLDSLGTGMGTLGLQGSPVILSDSSPGMTTVEAGRAWAQATGAKLIVEHSDARRSLKAALNAAFDRAEVAEADIVVVTVGDVLVPAASLVALLGCLLADPRRVVAVGVTAPDPAYGDLRRRASAWQLRAVSRLAGALAADAIRTEGALWAGRREFLESFRHRIGEGPTVDDVELAAALRASGFQVGNAADAYALKVPPALREFAAHTARGWSLGGSATVGRRIELRVAAAEAVRDPLGAALYCCYRFATKLGGRWLVPNADQTEYWQIKPSTWRT